MLSRTGHTCAGLYAVVVLLLSHAALCQSPFNLTAIPGTKPFSPGGINNQGQVVGAVAPANEPFQVLLWSRLGGSQTITIEGNSFATSINEAGQIVGGAGSVFQPQSFLWDPVTGVQSLDSLGADQSVATAINNAGLVVGYNYFSQIGSAFLWTEAQGMQDFLPQITGGSFAMDVNNAGQVVGFYVPNGNANAHGFLWTDNVGLQDLGTLGGTRSFAYAINDGGTVVGGAERAGNNNSRAFSWTQEGGMQDLGTLNGSSSVAYDINNHGWIVGISSVHDPSKGPVGFLSMPGSAMRDLTKGLTALQFAVVGSAKVNDLGVIVLSTDQGIFVLSPKIKTTLTSSPNPSAAGQPVTFTATLSSIAGPPPDGEAVQFKLGAKLLGTAPLTNGVAQFTTSSLKAGTRRVQAFYGGDANYASSKASVTQIVNP